VTEVASQLRRDDILVFRRGVRLQFERSQNCWVLLYPEGMVQLSDSASAILKLLDGIRNIEEIIRCLDESYNSDTGSDVIEFLETAHERRWITRIVR
jgi:pyrroloquinoline quinone biosynthesis protein D